MNLVEALILLAVTSVVLPVVVYFCVKLGTYAYYRGRSLFLTQERTDGEKSK